MLTQVLKALSDENRLRMVNLLKDESLCVCELEMLLEMQQSNVSRHLNRLREAGIIRADKYQQWVHYDLDPAFISMYGEVYHWIEREIVLNSNMTRDRKRLSAYRMHHLNCTEIKENFEKVKRILEVENV